MTAKRCCKPQGAFWRLIAQMTLGHGIKMRAAV